MNPSGDVQDTGPQVVPSGKPRESNGFGRGPIRGGSGMASSMVGSQFTQSVMAGSCGV